MHTKIFFSTSAGNTKDATSRKKYRAITYTPMLSSRGPVRALTYCLGLQDSGAEVGSTLGAPLFSLLRLGQVALAVTTVQEEIMWIRREGFLFSPSAPEYQR
jgi:hypothetical protein